MLDATDLLPLRSSLLEDVAHRYMPCSYLSVVKTLMTDGESARHRRNTPMVDRAELMTDGAIRCRLLFTSFPAAVRASRQYAARLEARCPGLDLRFPARWFPDQSSRALGGGG